MPEETKPTICYICRPNICRYIRGIPALRNKYDSNTVATPTDKPIEECEIRLDALSKPPVESNLPSN